MLQGGPAVSIEGDVAKGIIIAVPPKDSSTTDNDEDDDGIEDSKEGSASIASYGSAAALRIGSASAINIGATQGTGTGFGLIVDGSILGDGVYAGVDGNALQIGGTGRHGRHRQRHRGQRFGPGQVARQGRDGRPHRIRRVHAGASQCRQDPGRQRIDRGLDRNRGRNRRWSKPARAQEQR